MDNGISFSETFGNLSSLFYYILLLFLFALAPKIIGLLLVRFKKGKKVGGDDFSRYSSRKSVLTKNELDFYRCLKSFVGEKYIVLSQVRLADIFSIKDGKGYYQALDRIAEKSVDFLLCSPKTFKPFLAIEVDDRTHNKADRRKRDKFVNGLFESQNLPILRYKAKKTYVEADVKEQVLQILRAYYSSEENKQNSTI
jgi:hypothetical protein